MRWELSANEHWEKTLFTTLHCYEWQRSKLVLLHLYHDASIFGTIHPLKCFLGFPKMTFTPGIKTYTGNLGNLRRLICIITFSVTESHVSDVGTIQRLHNASTTCIWHQYTCGMFIFKWQLHKQTSRLNLSVQGHYIVSLNYPYAF